MMGVWDVSGPWRRPRQRQLKPRLRRWALQICGRTLTQATSRSKNLREEDIDKEMGDVFASLGITGPSLKIDPVYDLI